MQKGEKTKTGGKTAFAAAARRCGVTFTVSSVVTVALFLGAALLLSLVHIPKSVLQPVSTALASVGAAVGGYISTKNKGGGLVTGATGGLALFAGVMLIYAFISHDELTIQAIYKLIAFVASGGLGGVAATAAANKEQKAKRIH